MLVIRLSRVGKKKEPSYRILVQEKSKDPWGKAFENVGFYNPRTTPKTLTLKEDRIKAWIAKGAQPSPTLHNLLVDAKVIDSPKKKAMKKSKKGAEAAANTAKQEAMKKPAEPKAA